MLSLSIMMLKWAAGALPRLFKGASWSGVFSRDAAPAWGSGLAIILVGLAVWHFKPFRPAVPKGVMTVKECGGVLEQMRADTLDKAGEKQRASVLAANAQRDAERDRAQTAEARAAELEALLSAAEAKGSLGVSIETIRKWNKGIRP